MAINVQVDKIQKENNMNLIKKFKRRVQESGILPRVKSIRFSDRPMSPYVKKVKKLKSIRRKAEIDEKIKLGKITPKAPRGRR
jgi:ribosomal protein S21